jgi:predicted nucleic acid-binding protein
MNYTIDASVFIASARASEPHHAASVDFFDQLNAQQPDVFCPSLILAECGSSLAKRTGDPALAFRLVSLVKRFTGMRLIPLSLPLAENAARLAVNFRLRGADSLYTAVAEELPPQSSRGTMKC